IAYGLAAEGPVDLALYDVRGRMVAHAKGVGQTGLNRCELDVSALSPGVYFLEVTSGRASDIKKVVVAR
ncbi:MAG: T9SS type A sorting domain-containing protein, partial [bacterium]